MKNALLPALLAIAGGLAQADEYVTNVHGLDSRNTDPETAACDDFFQHANGSWLTRNPVPDAYSRWSVSNEVRERNFDLLKLILEEAAADSSAPEGSNQKKIGDFFASAMDLESINSQGIGPLRADLQRIDDIDNRDELAETVTAYHSEGLTLLFNTAVYPDLKKSSRYLVYSMQGGLGLPERAYYLKDDADSEELRTAYRQHVSRMLQHTGMERSDASAQAEAILKLETRLAEASLSRLELRNLENFYNVVGVKEADKSTPNFPWSRYFNELGLADLEDFSFAHPKFFAAMDGELAKLPLVTWKAYLKWHLINAEAPYLSDEIVQADFDFFSRKLRGAKELRPRWKRVLSQTNDTMGEALGELYVAKAFPPETKVRALEMIENLRAALKDRLTGLEWMGAETKQMALKKLSTFRAKIGYPDEWRDYSKLNVSRQSYVDNVREGDRFEFHRKLAQHGQPIDRNEWSMAPQTVNAYYSPLQNEIVFPAAIMQPPYFDGAIDDAINYGAMGAVIGHELMHGFDDQGSRFDAQGNMKSWWSDSDREKFEARAERLVEQFNGFVALDDLHVNGELTLGENIADLGGLRIAYAALQMALVEKPTPKIDGLTQQQRFYYSWAQAWRKNIRDEALKLQVNTDTHSPANFRTLGPLANLEEFRNAFDCKPGDPMVAPDDKRVAIW